jgi:stress-induced morphogen
MTTINNNSSSPTSADPNADTRTKLMALFDAERVEIIDNSWQHAGHVAMKTPQLEGKTTGTHLVALIVSKQFEGVPTIQRQRQVHKALAEEFSQGLHALEIKALTPQEFVQRFS